MKMEKVPRHSQKGRKRFYVEVVHTFLGYFVRKCYRSA